MTTAKERLAVVLRGFNDALFEDAFEGYAQAPEKHLESLVVAFSRCSSIEEAETLVAVMRIHYAPFDTAFVEIACGDPTFLVTVKNLYEGRPAYSGLDRICSILPEYYDMATVLYPSDTLEEKRTIFKASCIQSVLMDLYGQEMEDAMFYVAERLDAHVHNLSALHNLSNNFPGPCRLPFTELQKVMQLIKEEPRASQLLNAFIDDRRSYDHQAFKQMVQSSSPSLSLGAL